MVNPKIRSLVIKLCRDYLKETNFPYERHIETVLSNAKILTKKLHADWEIVETAAYLHDITKLMRDKEDHHIKGSVESERILKSLNYQSDFIDKVKHCILTHSSDDRHVPQTVEAKIVASADGLSHFDIFDLMVSGNIIRKKMSAIEAKEALLKKYKKDWGKMMPEAREMAKDRYEAIKILLS